MAVTGSRVLDPVSLADYIDQSYRAAWALRGSKHDAEDLVQATFAEVLKRPRRLRDSDDLGYLLRMLRSTFFDAYRAAVRRPATR
jgi:RNA polymerase sigma-70 factor, ECF subfamily